MPTSTRTKEKKPDVSISQGPVGQSVPRSDGSEKVRGEPIFYADLSLPRMLHGRVLRSRYPHARILSVDVSKAQALPGVACVALSADIPGVKTFGRTGDQPVLSWDKVRFVGDAIALVAGETAEIAGQALELIDVQYEELPAVFSPKEAMAPGAPRVHDNKENAVRHFKLRKGDVDGAFKKCDVIVENTYQTAFVEHAYLEVEGAVASKGTDGSMTVWVPSQFPFKARDNLAMMLAIPPEAVRVINTNAGGGFGGKEDAGFETACRAALLSHLTGRPVKLVYSREESIISSSKRHPALIEYKSGATKDGRLQAVEVTTYLTKGAYLSVGMLMPPGGGLTAKSGFHAAGPYEIPNVKVDIFNVYTNTPFGGAFRGFGTPQMAFAHEAQMDELARRLGMDPIEIRLLNGLQVGSRTASDQLLENSVGYKESLRKAAEKAGWKKFHKNNHHNGDKSPIRRGMGIGSFMFATTLGAWPEYANCTMEIDNTGKVIVHAGIAELGQGSRTVLGQIAAQALDIPLEFVMVSARGDTASDQDSLLTVSSRGTLAGGNAVVRAAKEARQTLLEMAADMMVLPPDEVVLANGEFCRKDGKPAPSIKDVLLYCFKCGRRLIGKGWWCVPKIKLDPDTNQGNPFHVFAFGAQIIEVEVNTRTGQVDVKRVTAAQDVGKAINPKLVEAQMEGGVVMGLGMALCEEVVVDKGYVKNPSFATYLLPTSVDVPEIVSVIVEDAYPNGPFGAKGVGEPGTVATAAAVANAVYDAVGVRITQLPITPERVWKALQEKKAEAREVELANPK